MPQHQTITVDHVQGLELAIDNMMAAVPKITAFVLPGGHPLAAACTIWPSSSPPRRAIIDQLDAESQPFDPVIHNTAIVLSDYLFALARYVNYRAGVDEVKKVRCKIKA